VENKRSVQKDLGKYLMGFEDAREPMSDDDQWAEEETLFTWNELKQMFVNEEWLFR
jgi:hypothetical protein